MVLPTLAYLSQTVRRSDIEQQFKGNQLHHADEGIDVNHCTTRNRRAVASNKPRDAAVN